MFALKLTANPPTILKSGDASVITAVLLSETFGPKPTSTPKQIKFTITGRYSCLTHANQKAALYSTPKPEPLPEVTAPIDQNSRATVLVQSKDRSGELKIVAEAVGFPEARAEIVLQVSDSASLTGRVLDRDNKPVPGAKLTLLWKGKETYPSPENPQTTENGEYRFYRLMSYDYTLVAEKDGKKKSDDVEVRKVNVVHDIIFD